MFEDQNGYKRLAIEKNKKYLTPVYTFHYPVDGHAIMRKLIDDFHLCPKLCFMQTNDEPCTGTNLDKCNGACEKKEKPAKYNKRVDEAIGSLNKQPTYIIIDKGIGADDYSCILVENGKLNGMGYIPGDVQITDPLSVKDYIIPFKENAFIRNLLAGYIAKNPSKVRMIGEEANQSTENFQHEAFQ
jgi:DNA polymerase-3 subunit epsilon